MKEFDHDVETKLGAFGANMQDKLVALAYEAREHSYCIYSNYAVGACLLTKSGKLYQGCNLENAAFTPTVCAERVTFFKALYDGEREFAAIAVVSTGEVPGFPCGVCRQVMAEFCGEDFIVISGDREHNVIVTTLGELLPYSFGPKDLLK